jgi:hypothetical protein
MKQEDNTIEMSCKPNAEEQVLMLRRSRHCSEAEIEPLSIEDYED